MLVSNSSIAKIFHDLENPGSNGSSLYLSPDLTIELLSSETQIPIGEVFIYTLEVTNNGTGTAENVFVSDTLPEGITFLSASNGGVVNANGVVIWPLVPSLASGESFVRTLTMVADCDALGFSTNSAGVTNTFPDLNPMDNRDSYTIEFLDETNPTLTCPADITVSNDAGNCSAVVSYSTPTGSDNCAGSSTLQTGGLPSGSAFPVGTTTNTFEVTDASGNTTTCSFTVTVNDTENPTLTCPADITVSNDAGNC
ncbi:MAG TPA: HYR domain-containing protein, partial [Bacteroidales bacterium]|nr:HYR domain-containing protein [Bacteroidales bacterium]